PAPPAGSHEAAEGPRALHPATLSLSGEMASIEGPHTLSALRIVAFRSLKLVCEVDRWIHSILLPAKSRIHFEVRPLLTAAGSGHEALPYHSVRGGGSFPCDDNDCSSCRPGARHGCSPATGTSHVGFRCVISSQPARPSS